MANDDKPPQQKAPPVALGVALGAGIGAALFAATDSAVWIGVGVAVGTAVGAGWDARKSYRSRGARYSGCRSAHPGRHTLQARNPAVSARAGLANSIRCFSVIRRALRHVGKQKIQESRHAPQNFKDRN